MSALRETAIVLHGGHDDAAACGAHLAAILASHGASVCASDADAKRIGGAVLPASSERLRERFDVMFALGGDGTFLRAAEIAAGSATPLLGVNLGRVGFLTTIERGDLDKAVDRLAADGVRATKRMALDCEVDAGGASRSMWALNDVSVTRAQPGRLVKLGVTIGGEPLTALSADGVVVASPTGSTAYSFSSGGPIVSPDVDCIIVTPVSPHLVFDRAVVAPAIDEITIDVLDNTSPVSVSADGHAPVEAPSGSVIRVRRSQKPLHVAMPDGVPFWRLVRAKFRLPEPGS